MGDGIYIATAGAVAQSTALDVTANNIAHASTAGYQGARVTFSEALAKARSPDMALVGTNTGAVDATSGVITQTGNPFDIALDGPGYLVVDTPQGMRYTRAGALARGPDGALHTADGHRVRNQGGGAIVLPSGATDISFAHDGAVLADGAEIGRLQLATFAPGAMTPEGATLYAARGKPTEAPPPRVVQGALEGSNVNVVRGVVDLVRMSRTYESLIRVIQGYSEIESRAARDIGGPK